MGSITQRQSISGLVGKGWAVQGESRSESKNAYQGMQSLSHTQDQGECKESWGAGNRAGRGILSESAHDAISEQRARTGRGKWNARLRVNYAIARRKIDNGSAAE